MNDVKVDPYILVYNLLDMHFKEKKKVSYDKLLTFFKEFESYF